MQPQISAFAPDTSQPNVSHTRDPKSATEATAGASHGAPPSMIDQLYELRDRILSWPAFQRWAASFPFTRRTSARHARAVFDLCAGFVYSQILFAAVKLRLFDMLAERPMTAAELSARLDLPIDATTRLVRGAHSLGLLSERSGGRYGLGMLGAALRGNPGALAMIEHHALLYRDLADPVALLRGDAPTTRLATYWPYADSDDASRLATPEIAAYTALMAQSQSLISDDVLSAYDFGRHSHLLDVGGGDGSFLAAAARKHPTLQLSLFDLPAVTSQAKSKLDACGFSARTRILPGNFQSDALPTGADVISLVRVALDHDDATVLNLLKSIRAALPDTGTLVIAEPMRGLPGAETVGDAYFGFYLLAMGSGRARSFAELSSLLVAAGFERIRLGRTRRAILTGLITAMPKK